MLFRPQRILFSLPGFGAFPCMTLLLFLHFPSGNLFLPSLVCGISLLRRPFFLHPQLLLPPLLIFASPFLLEATLLLIDFLLFQTLPSLIDPLRLHLGPSSPLAFIFKLYVFQFPFSTLSNPLVFLQTEIESRDMLLLLLRSLGLQGTFESKILALIQPAKVLEYGPGWAAVQAVPERTVKAIDTLEAVWCAAQRRGPTTWWRVAIAKWRGHSE